MPQEKSFILVPDTRLNHYQKHIMLLFLAFVVGLCFFFFFLFWFCFQWQQILYLLICEKQKDSTCWTFGMSACVKNSTSAFRKPRSNLRSISWIRTLKYLHMKQKNIVKCCFFQVFKVRWAIKLKQLLISLIKLRHFIWQVCHQSWNVSCDG